MDNIEANDSILSKIELEIQNITEQISLCSNQGEKRQLREEKLQLREKSGNFVKKS